MKKTLLTVCALVTLFFANCKKEAANTADTTTTITTPAEYTLTAQNTANINGLKGLPNQDLKKIAFRLLSPIERYGAMVENARIVSANFNVQQKLLVVEFVAFFTPQVYDTPDRGKVASFRDAWLAKAQKVFTPAQIQAIAFQFFSSTDNKGNVQVNLYDSTPKCNCNAGSDYDCGDTACPRSDDMRPCKDPKSWGCGFGWAWDCNNPCIVLPYIPAD